jgi:hypothetical protein
MPVARATPRLIPARPRRHPAYCGIKCRCFHFNGEKALLRHYRLLRLQCHYKGRGAGERGPSAKIRDVWSTLRPLVVRLRASTPLLLPPAR